MADGQSGYMDVVAAVEVKDVGITRLSGYDGLPGVNSFRRVADHHKIVRVMDPQRKTVINLLPVPVEAARVASVAGSAAQIICPGGEKERAGPMALRNSSTVETGIMLSSGADGDSASAAAWEAGLRAKRKKTARLSAMLSKEKDLFLKFIICSNHSSNVLFYFFTGGIRAKGFTFR